MNLKSMFRFYNKNNGEEELKQILKKEQLNFPTAEQAIDAIISQFNPDQLKKLELIGQIRTYSFKERLLSEFKNCHTNATLETIKITIKDNIEKNIDIFKLKNTAVARTFLIEIIKTFFKTWM